MKFGKRSAYGNIQHSNWKLIGINWAAKKFDKKTRVAVVGGLKSHSMTFTGFDRSKKLINFLYLSQRQRDVVLVAVAVLQQSLRDPLPQSPNVQHFRGRGCENSVVNCSVGKSFFQERIQLFFVVIRVGALKTSNDYIAGKGSFK